jgi:Ran GTPase-activating protein (RanGAP) involved in mRNA processing and transport
MTDLKQFSVAVGDLNYILSLTFQGNFIDDEMISWLIPGLISNHTLRTLDLSNNKITENGMIKICSYLMRSKSLIYIDLTNNSIGPNGGFALSLVIKEETRLKTIKMGMNRLDDVSTSKIIKALGKNEKLEEIDLSSNECSLEV